MVVVCVGVVVVVRRGGSGGCVGGEGEGAYGGYIRAKKMWVKN